MCLIQKREKSILHLRRLSLQLYDMYGRYGMFFNELDESEGFILLGRRREKDFLSTWALLEDQVLASCFPMHLRRARSW